jgi:aryl-alcohol dehydrogenase-like predicted oxidoreductase
MRVSLIALGYTLIMQLHHGDKRFGLGLIGIGRPWGFAGGEVPSEAAAREFLEFAFDSRVRYFDTAPSYGLSERRLGAFLSSLDAVARTEVTVATKFGEHWDFDKGEPFVDHSFDALARSLEHSLTLLGRIDILQLHKTSVEVLRSPGLHKAWEFARQSGVETIGPSVADVDSAKAAIEDGRYQMLQLPLNPSNTQFVELLESIAARGLWIASNRPFAMGRTVVENPGPQTKVEAFGFLLRLPYSGVILSGTKSKAHLAENLDAFREAGGS